MRRMSWGLKSSRARNIRWAARELDRGGEGRPQAGSLGAGQERRAGG